MNQDMQVKIGKCHSIPTVLEMEKRILWVL